MRPILLTTLIVLVIATLPSCSGPSADGDGKLRVVATTQMIADAVHFIAGDKVELYGLMGPGVDPHLYKATKGDIDHINAASVIFYNGLHLEAKLTDILVKMGRAKTTVPIGDAVPESLRRFPENFQGNPDPHIWFDASLWALAVDRITATLVKADSVNADLYRKNGRAFVDSLHALHAWIQEQIAQIPPEQRLLITAHDAFGYFGRAYGIEVSGLQGISTVTEAGLYDVTHMIDQILERKTKAVFVESSVPKKTIEAVVEGCRSRGHEVAIGGQLFSDAMGAADTPEGNYLGMVRYNVTTIVNALK